MCILCRASADIIQNEFLPGYQLVRAKQPAQSWLPGQYAIACGHTLLVIFQETPVLDSFNGMTDEEINAIPLDEFEQDFNAFGKVAQSAEEGIVTSDIVGIYDLVDACQKAGWDRKRDGYRVVFWLTDRAARVIAGLRNVGPSECRSEAD